MKESDWEWDMITKLEGLIFDLDDTVVRTEALNVELITGYFRDVWKVVLDEDDKELVFGHSWQDIYGTLVAKYDLPITKWDVQDGILARKQVHLDAHGLEMATGIRRMMTVPQKKVIVSGSGKNEIKMILDAVRLTDFFDAYFSVDEYLKGKPEPDGFLMALDFLDMSPDRVLVFEDSPSGLEAARRAGLITVFIRELAENDSPLQADYSFDDFEAFYEEFKGLLLG